MSAPTSTEVPAGLPALTEIGEIIGGLVGREVTVAPHGADDVVPAAVAIYEESETGRPFYAVLADLGFTAFPAAALTMIPPGAARDVVAEGELTPVLEENAFEVFNVLSRVFNGRGRPHIRLRGVYAPGECPPDASKLTSLPQVAYTVEASVDGYGGGAARLTTLSAADRARA